MRDGCKKENTLYHTSKPDTENLIKAIKDALNKVAYYDDAQVYEIKAKKFYGNSNGINIRIKEIEDGKVI